MKLFARHALARCSCLYMIALLALALSDSGRWSARVRCKLRANMRAPLYKPPKWPQRRSTGAASGKQLLLSDSVPARTSGMPGQISSFISAGYCLCSSCRFEASTYPGSRARGSNSSGVASCPLNGKQSSDSDKPDGKSPLVRERTAAKGMIHSPFAQTESESKCYTDNMI